MAEQNPVNLHGVAAVGGFFIGTAIGVSTVFEPENWYVWWPLAIGGVVWALFDIRAAVGRWWRQRCEDESAAPEEQAEPKP